MDRYPSGGRRPSISGTDEHPRNGRTDPASTVGILVVEDDDGLRDLQVTWLERAFDQPIHKAATGAETVEILESEPLAVLVLDRHLPDMKGHEVHERLDETGFDGHVIVCSAVLPDDRLNEDNTAAYLRKPITEVGLVETVEQFL